MFVVYVVFYTLLYTLIFVLITNAADIITAIKQAIASRKSDQVEETEEKIVIVETPSNNGMGTILQLILVMRCYEIVK